MNWNPNWQSAIASIESAGSGNYGAVGPLTKKGNRAYGRYQVMDFNIPSWTKKYLGKELTPDQFLNSPEAQDAVFKGEFGSYVDKYGNPQDAASMWFTGRPASQGAGRSDVLGTTGADYVSKFNKALKDSGAISAGIASDTMTALGKQPKGILAPQATDDTESRTMTPQDEPRGLLGSLGIQKMEEGAAGETGQRFYERDTFKDTAATLAQGFAAMGSMPGLQKMANDVAAQRSEGRARNKTVEYLRKNGRGDLADMVEKGLIGGREAAAALMQKPKDDRTALMKNYEFFVAQGMSPEEAMQAVRSGTTINMPGQKGITEFEKLDAKTLSGVAETGMAAGRSLAQIDRLGALLDNVPTGAVGALKIAAGNFGVQTEGLDDLQAAQALINSLVPQQRPAGSGPMSDADLELFKQSLPRIINSPNGNQIILETMRGIAQYDAMGAEIVQRYRSDPEFSQADAFAALQARPDPFAKLNLVPSQSGDMSREDALKVLGEG